MERYEREHTMTRNRRPTKKQRKRERREAASHGLTIEQWRARQARRAENAGRGARRRNQDGGGR